MWAMLERRAVSPDVTQGWAELVLHTLCCSLAADPLLSPSLHRAAEVVVPDGAMSRWGGMQSAA